MLVYLKNVVRKSKPTELDVLDFWECYQAYWYGFKIWNLVDRVRFSPRTGKAKKQHMCDIKRKMFFRGSVMSLKVCEKINKTLVATFKLYYYPIIRYITPFLNLSICNSIKPSTELKSD